MARKGVSYVTDAEVVSMLSDPRVAIIDVRYVLTRPPSPFLGVRARS
jgi:hypothetical protein